MGAGAMITGVTTYRTSTGRVMTEADLDALAVEVLSADYDPSVALPKVTRPRMGSGLDDRRGEAPT